MHTYLGVNLEKARLLIAQSYSGENEDDVLTCCSCKLAFSSLHSKQSHFAGKLHLQTLFEHIESLLQTEDQGISRHDGQVGTSNSVKAALEVVAAEYHRKFFFFSLNLNSSV